MSYKIIIALGTNVRLENINYAQSALIRIFDNMRFSDTIQTKAIGERFYGTMFYNAIAIGSTSLNATDVTACLKTIEKKCGDNKENRHLGKVILDLDLLEHNGQQFHEDDWEREYIKKLLNQ